MKSWLLLAALSLVLAGCTVPGPATVVDTRTESGQSGPAPAVVLETPTVVPALMLGDGDGEPNIAVAPDGTIYITPVSNLYVSHDGGKSFTDLGTAQTTGHGDGDIVVDATGRLHWLGLGTGIPYQHSDDGGRKFSKPVDVSDGTGSDREWIDATRSGAIYTAWRDADGYAFNASLDGGATWLGKVKVAEDFLGGPVIHDATDESRIYIPGVTFGDLGRGAVQVNLYTSEDRGTSWEPRKVMDVPASPGDPFFTTQIFPVAASDAAGNLYLVVSVKQGLLPSAVPKPADQYGVFLTVSTDKGLTWSAPKLISAPQKVGIMPWVAAGAPGRIAVAWYENTVGAPNDVLPDAWNVKLLESVTADTADLAPKVVQLNGQPNHIGSICTNGTLCVAGGDRSLLDFFEIALDPQGQPVATWASSLGGTGIGLAAQGPQIWFGTVQGTSLI